MRKQPTYELTESDRQLLEQARWAFTRDFTYLESVLKGYYEQFCIGCGKPREHSVWRFCKECRNAAPAHPR